MKSKHQPGDIMTWNAMGTWRPALVYSVYEIHPGQPHRGNVAHYLLAEATHYYVEYLLSVLPRP